MRLIDMLGSGLDNEKRNNEITQIVYNSIPERMIMRLIQHSINPPDFASGINFILQHFQMNGIPEDWEELTAPVTPPDPAKVSGVALTEEDQEEIPSEVEEFMMAWMKWKRKEGPGAPGGPALLDPPELC